MRGSGGSAHDANEAIVRVLRGGASGDEDCGPYKKNKKTITNWDNIKLKCKGRTGAHAQWYPKGYLEKKVTWPRSWPRFGPRSWPTLPAAL